jgi:hypothetical protein
LTSLEVLHSFIRMFDDADGFPYSTYTAVCDLILHTLGKEANLMFRLHIKATDEKFYFKNTKVCDECWQCMLNTIPEPKEAN